MNAVISVVVQQRLEGLPAQPPIDGWVWSYLVPALLLAVASVSTWLLYRRFSRDEGSDKVG